MRSADLSVNKQGTSEQFQLSILTAKVLLLKKSYKDRKKVLD